MRQSNDKLKRPKLILLDVYETLLDVTELERRVNNLMNSKTGFIIWFQLFMQYSFVDNCTVQFHDFASIAKATMQMTANTLGRTPDDDEINDVLELLKHLPLHEGVQEGLSHLHDLGFRIAALTNSPQRTVLDRMERTGLVSYFEVVLSAEQVKKYKPCIEVYEWAAKKLQLNIHEILLVSAHEWDVAGGANAGMQTAYMRKRQQMLYPLAPEPNIICKDLSALANQMELTMAKEK